MIIERQEKEGWGNSVVERLSEYLQKEYQVESRTYERLLLNQTNFDLSLPEKEKNRIIIEYALKDTTQPIGVSTYKITTTLPKDLRKYLPSGEEIAKRLEDVEI